MVPSIADFKVHKMVIWFDLNKKGGLRYNLSNAWDRAIKPIPGHLSHDHSTSQLPEEVWWVPHATSQVAQKVSSSIWFIYKLHRSTILVKNVKHVTFPPPPPSQTMLWWDYILWSNSSLYVHNVERWGREGFDKSRKKFESQTVAHADAQLASLVG